MLDAQIPADPATAEKSSGIFGMLREAVAAGQPFGYEDETGFHYSIKPVSARTSRQRKNRLTPSERLRARAIAAFGNLLLRRAD